MANSFNTKTIKHLESLGYVSQVCETWNYYAKKKKDLFGFVDLIALNPELKRVLGVQLTSRSNVSARVKKILKERANEAKIWLRSGNYIVIFGWNDSKPKTRDGRAVEIKLDENGELSSISVDINTL